MKIIGRKEERLILEDAAKSPESEFIVLYGRRRIGKTYLIENHFINRIFFSFTGLLDSNLEDTLSYFSKKIGNHEIYNNWIEAFGALEKLIISSSVTKKVIFLDELPWLDIKGSNFISHLEYFWNSFCAKREDILLIVSGSSTSWIVDNIINNIGGLYNRISRRILLKPFTLLETEQYFKLKNINYSRYSIAEAYMIFGGIPYYLNFFKSGLSFPQNVDNIIFSKNAPLENEYNFLFKSLFKNDNIHKNIITALSNNSGLTRKELVKILKCSDNGRFGDILSQLEDASFIVKMPNYPNKEKESIYKISDSFICFYNYFLKDKSNLPENFYTQNYESGSMNAFRGLAFERVCINHIYQIKKSLGISGVHTISFSFNNGGAQIDIVIDRRDMIINLIECKFSINKYVITKDYEEKLRNKISTFIEKTKTKKAIILTFITSFGLQNNMYSYLVTDQLLIDDLFV